MSSKQDENGSSLSRTRGRPTPDMAAQIDQDILDAARDLFFAEGYARTSMAMVVRAAGVSKTTLYARYADKADLFRATVASAIERNGSPVMTSPEHANDDAVDGLERFGVRALAISLAPLWSSYERLVFAEGLRFPEMTDAVAVRVQIAIERIAEFLQMCADRDGLSIDPQAVATVYIMALRGYFTAAMLAGRVPPEEEQEAFVRQLVRTVLRGQGAALH